MQLRDQDRATLIAAGAIVLAFLGLSLAVTATGSARFAVALGHDARVGYAVGTVFDIAKALLPVILLALLARRAVLLFAVIGCAWIGLVTYSALATHGTVTLAIANFERAGSWKMETRANAKMELASVEQRLAVLSTPMPPRPTKTVLEAIHLEKVPAGVWRDSRECQNIRDSRYFRDACAKILELRSELAAADDYEELEARAGELRAALAVAPLVAATDPLAESFASTLGRLLPLNGRAGVALLLTLVIEIMSCFGFATLRALRKARGREVTSREEESRRRRINEGPPSGTTRLSPDTEASSQGAALHADVPKKRVGLASAAVGHPAGGEAGRDRTAQAPSKVIPLAPTVLAKREGGSPIPSEIVPPLSEKGVSLVGSHIPNFVRDCLQRTAGRSLAAADLWGAYIKWCAAHGHISVSQQRFGLSLAGLGLAKWKSCGLIRYRDIQLAA